MTVPGKKKSRTKFKEQHHRGTPYFKQIIQKALSNSCRFLCLACKERFGKNYDGFCGKYKISLKD